MYFIIKGHIKMLSKLAKQNFKILTRQISNYKNNMDSYNNREDIKQSIKKIEPIFYSLLPILCHENDIYRKTTTGSIDHVGAKCCGESTWIMKGLIDFAYKEKYETSVIGQKEIDSHSEYPPEDHVSLMIKTNEENFIIDASWKQFFYNKIDVSKYPSILIASQNELETLAKKLHSQIIQKDNITPWFVYGSSQGQQMLPTDPAVKSFESNNLSKMIQENIIEEKPVKLFTSPFIKKLILDQKLIDWSLSIQEQNI